MRWRVRKPGAKQSLKHKWHLWFAWHPVRVPTKGRMSGQHMVWLEKVQRKGRKELCYDGSYWVWSYKTRRN
jgi:hypothetical protein